MFTHVLLLFQGMELEIDFDDDVFPGSDFKIKVIARNATEQTRVCRVTVKLTATRYTGDPLGNAPFHRETFDVCPVRPGKGGLLRKPVAAT